MGRLALSAAAWAVYLLPHPMRELLARAIAGLLGFARFRSAVIEQNLGFAFPGEAGVARREELARAAHLHLARLALEILLLFGPMRRFVLSRSRLIGTEHWSRASATGKGVLFLSSHVGNWEVMAATGALHSPAETPMRLMLVTKHLKPEWFHRAIEKGRAACGVSATYEPHTLRDVLGHLKKGGTVGFVQDQYAGAPVGVRVPFFGVPVGTISAVAVLAKRTGASVLPVVNYRDASGRFTVEILAPMAWEAHENPDYEIASNTARYSAELERHVRAHPEQWLWTHRRFKGDLSPLRPDEWKEGRART